jgi:anaerobic carbon-monoxide dehydrogenase iron sulfur subunit
MKGLILEPLRCNGCGECEKVCSFRRMGANNPDQSCIRIAGRDGREGFCFPVVCFQCSDAPCVTVCPAEALLKDKDERVMIRDDRCIGCRMCVAACPFGAMGFDKDLGRSFKCDLCGGSPECVRICEPGALLYMDTNQIGPMQGLAHAGKFLTA